MQAFTKFVQDEDGLSGAETALLCLVGLGLLLFVAKKIRDGSEQAANKAEGMLKGQGGAAPVPLNAE